VDLQKKRTKLGSRKLMPIKDLSSVGKEAEVLFSDLATSKQSPLDQIDIFFFSLTVPDLFSKTGLIQGKWESACKCMVKLHWKLIHQLSPLHKFEHGVIKFIVRLRDSKS
jgi:hypothetical protein